MARRVDVRWKWKTPRTSREWKRVLHMPGLVDALMEHGDDIKQAAINTAPVDTGEYKASFVVVEGEGADKKRAAALVGNTAPHARFVEFGGGATPDYHTLANAAASRGKSIAEVD